MNLRGSATITVDSKGRIAVPATYRNGLKQLCDSRMVITHNPHGDHCAVLYPENNWLKVEQQLKKLPDSQPQVRKLKRKITSAATDINIDKSGRILLPLNFRQHYQLTGEVIIAGRTNFFEIWDLAKWNEENIDYTFEQVDLLDEIEF